MGEDHIRYDILVQEALRGVVRKVMGEVAKTGLPGDHHFFISFATKAPGVRISERLLEQYEKEMTIVIQHQYWDFKVNDNSFEIGLSFDGKSENLEIPFSAIKGFFDPSVQFGLQFDVASIDKNKGEGKSDNSDEQRLKEEVSSKEKEVVTEAKLKKKSSKKQQDRQKTTQKSKDKNSEDNKIVSLDSFRKK